MPRRLIAITGLAATALLGFGPAAFAEPPAVATAKVENFTLVDQAGASHELYKSVDAPAIVIATQVNCVSLSRQSIKTPESLKARFRQAHILQLTSSQAPNPPPISHTPSPPHVPSGSPTRCSSC